MADIICRWRNGTPKTVVELVNALPHTSMRNDEFRLFMQKSIWGNDFFHTPYQLACQLGLYCEAEDGYYYPRFDHDISEKEAQDYLEHWMPRYYVPNPYVGRNGFNDIKCPTYVLYELYKYATKHKNCTYKEAYEAVFQEKPTNNNDIVKNYINNYSKILRFEASGLLTITDINPNTVFDFMDRNNKKEFFENFSNNNGAKESLLVDQMNLTAFVLSTTQYFDKFDRLNALIPYSSINSPIKVSKEGVFSLTGMFLESNLEDVRTRNSLKIKRWFEDQFTLGERNVFLSTQWNANGDYQLTLDDFIKMIQCCYGTNYKYKTGPNGEHQLWKSGNKKSFYGTPSTGKFLPYLAALRTKPFMLLAGISGTGKSRIVRELAKACWQEGDEEYGKNHPKNFCMVQVKPNWHDSSELIGYVSRINGEKYVVGPFLRFMAKAIKDENTPYFLCLDEMNLAPVEQYFAEYLSVIESRKLNADGSITTDPIIPFEDTEAYGTLIDQLFDTEADRVAYKSKDGKRLTIPQNLFVVGTVNMDETTFSFSRKVLDRAMTIEMNEVDLKGGLEEEGSEIGYIGNCIIGEAAEGKDVYADNKDLCDKVITYLEKVNIALEGTPFKIAYRTRNEFLLYAVNRQLLDKDSQLWQTLDEMTSMKILSRIEGDSERTKEPLNALKTLVEQNIINQIPEPKEGETMTKSVSAAKIKEMLDKLDKTSYTSYWA